MIEDFAERFNKLLCEYFNTEHDLGAARVLSTDVDHWEGCDTCSYGEKYVTYVCYEDSDGARHSATFDINLNDLLNF